MNPNNMMGDLVLQDINTGEKFILDHKEAMYKCGRATGSQVLSQSILASREHCMFIRASGGLNVIDLGSSNGIFINGARQQAKVMIALNINDLIGLGCAQVIPNSICNPKSQTVYKLLLHEAEQAEPAADSTQQSGDVTTRITSENKRRQSRDSLENNVPLKVAKLEIQTSIPDIIDISDESNDKNSVSTKSDNNSFNHNQIAEESKITSKKPNAPETGATSNAKQISRSLQEDSSEIAFVAGTSTSSSAHTRKKSEDSDRNANPSNAEKPNNSSNSSRDRKSSEDTDRSANPSNIKKTSNSCISSRDRKSSEDTDRNASASNAEKVNNSSNVSCDRKRSADGDKISNPMIDEKNQKPSKRKKCEEIDKNCRGTPPEVREHDELQPPATVNETNSAKPADFRRDRVQKEKTKSAKRPAVVKSSKLKEQVVPSRGSSGCSSTSSEETRNAKEANGCLKNVEESVAEDFLVPAFDMDEFNLQERMECLDNQRKSDENSASESTIQRKNNGCTEQLIKYEPELNIVDDDESAYGNLKNVTDVAVPTPIRLKRMKQEPKTRYSEFDVVVLSDDEDGVFPASQLFGDESDDEIDHKVQIKDEAVDDNDRDIFENRRDDIPDTIVLSDSDDEDNPWYDRLLRSQLLNESRQSLNDETKEEVKAEIVTPLDEEEHVDQAEGMGEAELTEEAERTEEAEHSEVDKEKALFEEEEEIEENAQEIPFEDVEKEIYDLCFADDDSKTKKSVFGKQKRKDKKTKSIEKGKAIEDAVPEAPLEKQSTKDTGKTEEISKKKKSLENKAHKEKTTLEDQRLVEAKRLPEGKRTSRKKPLSDEEKKSLEEKSVSVDKRLSDEKSVPVDKRLSDEKSVTVDKRLSDEKSVPVDKRLPEKKIVSADKRLPEKKRPCVEKQPSIEKPSLTKQKSVEKVTEVEKLSTRDAARHKPNNKNEAEKRRRSNEAKPLGTSESSNDKPDLAEPKSNRATTSANNRLDTNANPVVILTKLDNSVGRSVQLVDAPFLLNGEGRGVSCNVTRTPAASTSGTKNHEIEPARKLTTKEKKDLKLKSKIEEKMQLKEQRHRRLKNKWAAECLPVKKKPAIPSFTSKERKDIVNDRKERLKQIANEKKMAEGLQPSPARRIPVKPRAKVTINSRNDFLVKELEEQAKWNSVNSERVASESGDKSSESAKQKDKSLELRTEAAKSVETTPVHEEKSSSGRKTPSEKTDRCKDVGSKDTAEEKILQTNENNLSKVTKEKGKPSELANGFPVNGEIDRHLGTYSVKPIPKKTKSSAILIDQSELPSRILEKSLKQTAIKPSMIPNGLVHKFGEPSQIVGQTLASSTNIDESSRLVRDPRVTIGKSRKSALKENREPKASKEGGQTRTTKRVSFNDLTTKVEFFEIDPGNSLKKCVSKDAPMVLNKLPKCNTVNTKVRCPKLELFLLHIFKWNPVWLEEQKQFSTAPPVVDEKKLVPLLSKYTNYRDYYNVLEPLMALELWYGITRDCEGKMNEKACFKFSIVNHSVVLTTIPSTDAYVTTLMLEVVVSKRDAENQAHPVYGDLIFFEYFSNRKSKQGCQMWKVFAYITNVRQTVITSMTQFNRDLLSFTKDPHVLLTYMVMTKPLNDTEIMTDKVSRLRTISYLRSNIRMIQAVQNLPLSPLCNMILHPKIEDYQMPPAGYVENYPLVTKDKLNSKQLEAVVRVTYAAVQKLPKVCLIQGPPGTGKSRVIVNLVTQILYGNARYQSNKKMRILVCAPSNAAIDEIVLRLLDIRRTFQKGNRFNMVRIGRNESMHPLVKEVSVTELAIKDVKKTADTYMSPNFTSDSVEEEKRFLQARINALELEKSNGSSRKDSLYQNQIDRKLGDIRAKYSLLTNRRPADRLNSRELARLQKAAENSLLKGADVITCTLTSCFTNHMETIFAGKDSISVCIVDEATQSTEAETLIPLMLGVRTLVLVGDTNQLPATVLSQKAKQFGLGQSLFARIQNAFDGQENSPIILLDTQYRMSYPVSYWPNRYFYGGAIRNEAEKYPFPFHCYKVMNLDSTQNEDKFSNTEEASFVANLLYTLMTRSKLDHLNAPVRIGIITPYNNQKQLVIEKIRERTAHVSDKVKKKFVHEVNTVDSFQGQERDVIIMSCVRSNGIGFLSDRQRLCVALTRAKHSLILCGNFRTFQRDPMWSALLSDARDRKAYVRIKSNAETDEIKSHVVR